MSCRPNCPQCGSDACVDSTVQSLHEPTVCYRLCVACGHESQRYSTIFEAYAEWRGHADPR